MAGRNITELVCEFKDALLGKRVYDKYGDSFPLLVKFIDADDDQVGSIPMRYNGDLVRFEDARPFIYDSAMNDYNPNPAPSPQGYNPSDEFNQNEFVQTEFDGNIQ